MKRGLGQPLFGGRLRITEPPDQDHPHPSSFPGLQLQETTWVGLGSWREWLFGGGCESVGGHLGLDWHL